MTPEEISFIENFLYPLILIIFGGIITGLLLPQYNQIVEKRQKDLENYRHIKQLSIDRKRADHEKELEIKSDLVVRISQTYGFTLSQLFKISSLAPKENNERRMNSTEFHNWFKDRGVSQSLMVAYFRDTAVVKKWKDFSNALVNLWTWYDAMSRKTKAHVDDINNLKTYFKEHVDIDWDNNKEENVSKSWELIIDPLYIIKDSIIEELLDQKLIVFKKEK